MSDFAPGVVVVKIGGGQRVFPIGAVRRVAGICRALHFDDPKDGLLIEGAPPPGDYECECFHPDDWRKLNDGADDAGLIARIKQCKPVREGQPA